MAGLIPGVRNAGVILEGLSALPGSTQMLVVTSGGVMQSQAIPGSSVAWGSITGTLSSQSDLQSALDGKAALVHTHVVSDLVSIASGKLIGRHGSGVGAGQEIGIDGGLEFHGGNLRTSAITGDVSIAAGGSTATIGNLAVTNAKINDVAWSKITSTPTTLSGYGITDAITSAAVAAGYQPLDSDLTAIAALSTTSFGRGLLTETSASTARTTLGLGSSDTPTFAGLTLGTSGIFVGGTNLVEQRNDLSAQTFRIYNTFTNASNYERGKLEWASNVFRIGTEKAGTGSARALELQTDGTTRARILATGDLELGTIAASTSAPLKIQVNGQGRGFLISNTSTDYTEFVSGGVVKGMLCQGSVPFAVWNGNDIYFQISSVDIFRITSTKVLSYVNFDLSTKNIVTDTTTGTKIGTGTTQKLGFYNATPVVQPTAVADATDAASVITQLNALLTRMRNLGLIAT